MCNTEKNPVSKRKATRGNSSVFYITDSFYFVTQTQIVSCKQASKFVIGTPDSPTEDVADLEDKTATELKKTPVTSVTIGEKSSKETSSTKLLQFHL